MAHAVGQLCNGLCGGVAVHGPQQRAVGGLQLGAVAVIDAVVQDEGRLHQAQLVLQLVPGLLLVQGDKDAARQNDAEGSHAELVVVPAQQGHPLAFDVGHLGLEVGHHLADVLCILLILFFHDGLAVGSHIADGGVLRELLLHAARDHIVYARGHFDLFFCHCCFVSFCHIMVDPEKYWELLPRPQYTAADGRKASFNCTKCAS